MRQKSERHAGGSFVTNFEAERDWIAIWCLASTASDMKRG